MAQKKTIGVGDRAFFYEINPFGDGGVWECCVCAVTSEGSYVVSVVGGRKMMVSKRLIFDSRIKANRAFRRALIHTLNQRLDKLCDRIEDLATDMSNLRKSLCNILVKMKEV